MLFWGKTYETSQKDVSKTNGITNNTYRDSIILLRFFLPYLNDLCFSYSTTALVNLFTHSTTSHKGSLIRSVRLSVNIIIIIDFVCQSVIPPVSKSTNTTVSSSIKSHFRLFSQTLPYTFGAHSLDV